MIRFQKQKLVLVVLAIVLLSMSACGKEKTSKDASEVRVAYFPNITHTQALVIKSMGTLEEKLGEDIDVTWTAFNAGPAEIEALFAGEVDLGYIGPVPAINAYIQSSGDLSIVAGATNGGAILVTKKELRLTNTSELDGLKVAIPQLGNTQHLSLLNLLSEAGLSTTSNGGTVEVVAAANADIKTLMEKGEIDAALVPEPWGSILVNDINANIMLDYKDVWRDGDYSTAVVIVNKDFKDSNPEIVEKFLAVHKEATLFINENMDQAKSYVNAEIEAVTGKAIDDAVLNSAFDRLIISEKISVESILDFAKIDKQEGFISKLPDDGLCDSSILDKIEGN